MKCIFVCRCEIYMICFVLFLGSVENASFGVVFGVEDGIIMWLFYDVM